METPKFLSVQAFFCPVPASLFWVWSGLSPILSKHFQCRRADIIVTIEETMQSQMNCTQIDLLTEPCLLVLPGDFSGPVDNLQTLESARIIAGASLSALANVLLPEAARVGR